MKHLFIVNPVAGGKHNRHGDLVREITNEMSGRKERYEIYTTKRPMDACEKIRDDAQRGEELRVYACGGDGTLNECVNGAARLPNVSVTHYPCGTGNDFVKMFGAEAERFHSISELIDGELRPLDLIEVNGRFGINICSVGIDARIGTDVHLYSSIPVIGGATGYVVSLIVNLARGVNQKLLIRTPEREMSGSFAMVCACNGRYYGGGFNPVPEAMPDDGLIDFLIVGSVTRIKFLSVIGKFAAGRYREIGDLITHIRGRSLEIISENELVVNIDGEAIRAFSLRFNMDAGGVNFIVPRDMRFFDKTAQNNAKNDVRA